MSVQTTLSAKITMCILGGDMRREEKEGKFDLGFTAPPGNFPLSPDGPVILHAGRKVLMMIVGRAFEKKYCTTIGQLFIFFSRETDS